MGVGAGRRLVRFIRFLKAPLVLSSIKAVFIRLSKYGIME
jgi:hypothetical protein